MFWSYVVWSICLIIGLVNIIFPHETVEITWAVRHGIDDEGRKSLEKGMRLLGVFIVVCCMVWLNHQLKG
jgi:hypothetical protein